MEADLSNAELAQGYYLREIGILAECGDETVLYAYANAGTNAEYIPAGDGAVSMEKRLRFSLVTEGVENITFASASVLYLAQQDFEEAMQGIQEQLDGKAEKSDANKITDDTTKQNYCFGINNGLLYIQTLDKVYNILDIDPVYGFIEHNDILSPDSRIEYIGTNKDYTPFSRNQETGEMVLHSWADFPIIKGNKPYMVKADGTPDYRLNENDYTKKEDGSNSDVANTSYDGGAFSWLPKIYKNEEMVGNDRVVRFSFIPRDGFEPAGFIDTDNNELKGVWIPMFYGAGMADGKMGSISGTQPVSNQSVTMQKNAIDAFGDRAKFFGGPIVETIIDLLIMFAKTTNLREVYGFGNCDGYVVGVSTNGIKQNAVIDGGQFYGTNDQKSLNKILHSIVLGSYQQTMRDPYTLLVNGRYKVSKNYSYSATGYGYTDTGISISKEALGVYPDKFLTVPGFGALPVEPFAGSSVTGGCSVFSANVRKTTMGGRFSSCSDGDRCSLRELSLYSEGSYRHWSIGAAILLLPPVGVTV